MNVIVTGASGGLGKELAREYAEQGNTVIAIARNEESLKELAYKFENIKAIAFDLKDIGQLDVLKSKIQQHFEYVDVLINNAGVLVNKSFSTTTIDDIRNLFDTNFTATACLIQSLFSLFNKRQSHVINIGSMGGFQGSVKFPGLSFYSASKGALAILTECLAEEYKDTNTHFNCLALGAVQTEMLNKAFPDFKRGVSAPKMAKYIVDFSFNGYAFFNGKIIPVSYQTP